MADKLEDINPTLLSRFESKVDRSLGQGPNGDCHLWTGWSTSGGLGQMSIKRLDGTWGNVSVHLVSWYIHTGSWPESFVGQKCGLRHCVRFDHLVGREYSGTIGRQRTGHFLDHELVDIATSRETDLAWAAGFLDGEGCFSLSKMKSATHPSQRKLGISVAQKHLSPLHRLTEVLECGKSGTQGANYYQWRIQSAPGIKKVVPQVYPYLVMKKREAQILLEFASTVGSLGRKQYRRCGTSDQEASFRFQLISELEEIRARSYGVDPVQDQTVSPYIGVPSSTDFAWAAGFLDADGHISVTSQQSDKTYLGHIVIGARQVRVEPLSRLQDIFGCGAIHSGEKAYSWIVSSAADVRNIIPVLLPYLVLKKHDAEIVFEFAKTVRSMGTRVVSLEDKKFRLELINQMQDVRMRSNV